MPENPPSVAPHEVPLPDHVSVSRYGMTLVLDVRWFRGWDVLGLVLIIAFGALVFIMARRGAPIWWTLPIGMVAVYNIYDGLADLVNHTRITIGDGVLDVRVGPLPWSGSQRLRASEIRQVFCEEKQVREKHGWSITYHVNAVTTQDGRVELVPELDDVDVARYLEQEIEKALGIVDREVPGELQKVPPALTPRAPRR